MYRPKSTDVWFNLPGVLAAYMPIAAPDPLAAQRNVAHSGARFGVYTATPGVLPTWSAAMGWTLNGTTQYLKTGIVPTATTCLIVRFSSAMPASIFRVLAGSQGSKNTRCYLALGNDPRRIYGSGGAAIVEGSISAGVLAVANMGYLNGVYEATTSAAWSGTNPYDIWLGTNNTNNLFMAAAALACNIQSVLISSRILSPAEIWLASHQMAYCEQKTDWNAWARRRRYYYAPSAAAGRVGIYGRRGAVALPGGVRIEAVK